MRSTDLTRQQLERIERVVKGHRRYYQLLWERARANDMTVADPFVERVLKAAEHVDHLVQLVEAMKHGKPQPYRPLAPTGKTSGLAWRKLPRADRQ